MVPILLSLALIVRRPRFLLGTLHLSLFPVTLAATPDQRTHNLLVPVVPMRCSLEHSVSHANSRESAQFSHPCRVGKLRALFSYPGGVGKLGQPVFPL